MVLGGPVLVLRVMIWCLVAPCLCSEYQHGTWWLCDGAEADDMVHGGPVIVLSVMIWCVVALCSC